MKTAIKEGDASLLGQLPDLWHLAVGYMGGSFGEVSAIALLLGGVYLLCTKTITWHIPVSIICTVAAFSGILYLTLPGAAAPQ